MSNGLKNIDDVLVKAMSNPVGGEDTASTPAAPVEKAVEPVTEVNSSPEVIESSLELPVKQEEEVAEPSTKSETSSDSPIDEYGNPVEKPKVYTEEEVQRLIHDRLSRGRRNESAPPPQQVQQIQQDFNPSEDSEEPWDQQLKKFVDQTITEREQRLAEQRLYQQESAKQAAFEDKFTSGMGKYTDFHQVVAGKPITDYMLLATRGLDNPAAFIYGASKLHPKELDRIARIEDRYAQASEVGRLHERMVKERKQATNTSRPLETPKGDLPQKTAANQISIDERINNYARQKRK